MSNLEDFLTTLQTNNNVSQGGEEDNSLGLDSLESLDHWKDVEMKSDENSESLKTSVKRLDSKRHDVSLLFKAVTDVDGVFTSQDLRRDRCRLVHPFETVAALHLIELKERRVTLKLGKLLAAAGNNDA